MKSKIFALILALTVVSWAQTSSQSAPSDSTQNAAPAEKAKASCCDKMGATGASCPRHGKKDAKDMASCCGGKGAMSCMKDDKTAAGCCKDSCGKDKTAKACCGGKECRKGCSSMKSDKTAKNCCAHERQS
ncbi:MAG TPA: hypothetical protein VE866_13015 [Candidatus Binatia bacterium]|nr:hypothetical protein [Candidatus Binatia bacterium]